jgi:hypothetical protein
MKKIGMRSWYKKSNLRMFFFSMLLTSGVFITSCGDDEEDFPQPVTTENTSIQSTNTGTTNDFNGTTSVSSTDTTDFPSTKAGQVFNGMAGFTPNPDSVAVTSGTPGTPESPFGTNGPTGY